MKRKFLYYSAVILFLFFAAGWIVYTTVPADPKREDTKLVSTVVTDVRIDKSTGDMLFKTQDDRVYYINRALQQKLSLDTLKNELANRKVEIYYYAKSFATTKHICELKLGDRVVYTEL